MTQWTKEQMGIPPKPPVGTRPPQEGRSVPDRGPSKRGESKDVKVVPA